MRRHHHRKRQDSIDSSSAESSPDPVVTTDANDGSDDASLTSVDPSISSAWDSISSDDTTSTISSVEQDSSTTADDGSSSDSWSSPTSSSSSDEWMSTSTVSSMATAEESPSPSPASSSSRSPTVTSYAVSVVDDKTASAASSITMPASGTTSSASTTLGKTTSSAVPTSTSDSLQSDTDTTSAAQLTTDSSSSVLLASASTVAALSTDSSAIASLATSDASTTSDASSSGDSDSNTTDNSGLQAAQVVGIAIGCLAAVVALILLVRMVNAHFRHARSKRLLSQMSFGTFGNARHGGLGFSGASTPVPLYTSSPSNKAEEALHEKWQYTEAAFPPAATSLPRRKLGPVMRPRSAKFSTESDTPFWLEELGLAKPPRGSRGTANVNNPRLSIIAPSDNSEHLATFATAGRRPYHARYGSGDSGNHLHPLRLRTQIPSPTLDGPAGSSVAHPLSSHGSVDSLPWSISPGDFPLPAPKKTPPPHPLSSSLGSQFLAAPPYTSGSLSSSSAMTPTRPLSSNNPFRRSVSAPSIDEPGSRLADRQSFYAASEMGKHPFELEDGDPASPRVPLSAQSAASRAHSHVRDSLTAYYYSLDPTTAPMTAERADHDHRLSSSSSLYTVTADGQQVWPPLSTSLPVSGGTTPAKRVSGGRKRDSAMEETWRTYSQILDDYCGTGRAL